MFSYITTNKQYSIKKIWMHCLCICSSSQSWKAWPKGKKMCFCWLLANLEEIQVFWPNFMKILCYDGCDFIQTKPFFWRWSSPGENGSEDDNLENYFHIEHSSLDSVLTLTDQERNTAPAPSSTPGEAASTGAVTGHDPHTGPNHWRGWIFL